MSRVGLFHFAIPVRVTMPLNNRLEFTGITQVRPGPGPFVAVIKLEFPVSPNEMKVVDWHFVTNISLSFVLCAKCVIIVLLC